MKPALSSLKSDFDMILSEQGRAVTYKRASATTLNAYTGAASQTVTSLSLSAIPETLSKASRIFGSFHDCELVFRFKADDLNVSGTPFAPSSSDTIEDGGIAYSVVKAMLDPSGVEWLVGVVRTA